MLLHAGCGDEADRFTAEVLEEERAVVHHLEHPEARWMGRTVLRIGVEAGPDHLEFSRISGLARDAEGRIFVADEYSHEVRVFSLDGAFLYRFGGQGSGPGELISPCCLSFGPEGDLWVRDYGNQRLNRYATGDAGAAHSGTVNSVNPTVPPDAFPAAFHPDGGLIDVSVRLDGRAGYFRHTRHHFALDGSRRMREEVPRAPPERTPTYHSVSGPGILTGSRGRFTGVLGQPIYAPRHVIAHGTGGDWAEVITSDYLVRWYDADGALRHVLTRDVEPGRRLTPEERAREAAGIEHMGGTGAIAPTQRRQPIETLFFDEAGRLWVQRFTSEGPAAADVIDTDGRYVAIVEWPRGVDLRKGWIDEEGAVGVIESNLGVMRAVVLRWEET